MLSWCGEGVRLASVRLASELEINARRVERRRGKRSHGRFTEANVGDGTLELLPTDVDAMHACNLEELFEARAAFPRKDAGIEPLARGPLLLRRRSSAPRRLP